MNYEQKLIEYIRNTEGNLRAEWIEDTTPLSLLSGLAEESLEKNNPEGMIAALFIYHQLTIEILKSIIIYSNFLIKISVYPTQFIPKENKKDLKYSDIISQLKYSVAFKGKEKIIEYSQKLNGLRNEFGHRIMDNSGYSDIPDKLSNIKFIFDEIFNKSQYGIYDLRLKINKIKQREEIQELMKRNNCNPK
jgi:hypothetical protein